MVVTTRLNSMLSPETADISEATKTYLENLVSGLKNEIAELRAAVEDKNQRITELEETVVDAVKRNVILASRIDEMEAISNDYSARIDVRIDDCEQYSRKDSLRIEGIPYQTGETNPELKDKVLTELQKLGASVNKTDIHRLHRSSGPRTSTDGSVTAQTIVKFTNWSARSSVYGTRFKGTLEDRKKRPIYANLDLTKRRLGLLKRAKSALQDHPYAHAYSNAECRLVVKNRRSKDEYGFNTNNELDDILGMLCSAEAMSG